MLVGRVDRILNGKISGWAFNSDAPTEHLVVRIMQGPKVIASGVANLVREDLPEAGIGDGDHAFTVPLPEGVTKMEGLMLIAQSTKHGEIVLPMADNDDRRIDQLFTMFSNQYEEALIALKEELDATKERCATLESAPPAENADLPPDLADRFAKLESRMDAAEVFFVRIDEMVHKLVEEKKKGKRKRVLGIF